MYPVNNPAREARPAIFSQTAWAGIKLLIVCLVTATVALALYVRVDSKNSKAAAAVPAAVPATVQAAGKGGSLLNLQSKQELRADYRGDQNAIQAMRSGQAKARTLASADIDGDAAPDLLAGYTSGGIGIVTIQRGNPEAFAPRDDSVFLRMYQGYNPASLLPTAQTYQVPVPADFLQAGDFNNDSRIDVVVGAQGRDLFLLAGDGQGNLDQPVQVALPGVVTAVAAGQFRAPDGRMDLAVGIDGPSGAQVLIYDGAEGVTGEPMRLALASPATALEFGEVDDSPFMGLSIATGSEINVVHGWGRKQSPQLESRVERIDTGMNVRGLASGFFMWSREGSKQLATLGDDGTIRIFGRGDLNTQPLTDKELSARARLRLQPKDTMKVDVETLSGWEAAKGESWINARELVTGNSVGGDGTTQNLLRSTHISFTGTDDLIVLGGSSKLDIVRQVDTAQSAPASANSMGGDFASTSIESQDAPATLALPQKLNGWRDLVVMESGSVSAILVPLAPTATITVDRTDDPPTGGGGTLAAASVCGAGANDCSLRGAVQFANANPGTVISLGTNTYTLNTNGNGGCVIESLATGNTIGDLETNVSTTFTGTGQGSTIINQIGTGTGPTFTGDRVLCMNVNLTAGLTFTFSGMTVAGGRDVASGIGGGGFIGGAVGTTLNLTNVTFANNQTSPAGMGQGPVGGGGVAVTGGDMNVTSCTFGAANNPGASRTSTTTANAATTLSGGGISYSAGNPLGSNGASGTLTITGTTFQRNTASSLSAGGGGLDVGEFNVSASTINLSSSTFDTNQATGTASGGGIINRGVAALNISTTSFTNNSAGNQGGGLYVAGGTSTVLNGTSASVTFSGNTATGTSCGCTVPGSSISSAGPIFVSGLNTTIGGDVRVTTNGSWTNNTGSAVSPTNFTFDGTANFKGNDSTTNVGGNFVFASGTFTADTSTFNFNGSVAQSITNPISITFFNLTNSNTTQPLTLNNSFAVNNTLSINGANAIFDPVAAAVISGTGTLTGTGTARVRRTGADSFFSQYTITNKTLTNLTVEYIGAAAQTASTTTYNILKINNGSGVTLNTGNTIVNSTLILQTGPLAVGGAGNTLTINNGITVGTGSLTSLAAGTVNYNQSSSGQGVIAGTYGNLTFSAFTKVLASSGTIGVAGTFNPNGVTTGHTIAGSTFDFNGTGAQTVPIFNFHNLTISGARVGSPVVTLAAGTIGVAGAFSHTATGLGTAAAIAAAIAGNTVDFNGSVAQTIGGTTTMNFNNLTFSNVGGVTQTLATINVAGNWTNNGTFAGNGNTVVFNGTSGTQTVSGNTTFSNLTISNAGATIAFGSTNTTIASTLSRTAGTAMDPGTGTFTFTGNPGSITGASAKTFNNLVINGGANVSNATGGNLTVKANFTNNGTFTQAAGISTTFDNTNATHNFAGAGATTFGSVIINAGTAIDAGSHNFSVGGANFTVTGTFTGNTGTVTFIGTIAQTMDGAGAKNFNNLTINNGVGGSVATSGSSPSVAGLLRIQAGSFTTASNFNNVQIDVGATMVATAASTINVAGNWTNSGTFTPSTGTVVFNGNNNTQTLTGSTTFNNLTINHTGTNNVTSVGSTLASTGLMRVQGGTFDVAGSTFNNVQIDAGQTLAGTNATTINVSGNWTNDGGTFTPNGNTVNFNGSGAQAITGTAAAQAFNNFIVNKSAGALTVSGSTTSITTNNLTMTLGTFTAPATLDINGNTLLTAGTLTAGANITAAGNWTRNGGTFTPGVATETVSFDGGAGQTIGGTVATVFNNLTNANTSGLAMAHDNTVNGILALTSSDITVAATKTLTQPVAGNSSGAFDVNGRVQRTGFVLGACSPAPCLNTLRFGNPDNQITITGGTAPANIVVDLTRTVPTGFSAAVQRFYTITPSATGFTGTLRLRYLESELNSNVEGANFILRRFNNVGWAPVAPTTSDFVNNWLEKTGQADFSPWTFSSTFSPTASNGVVTGRITDSSGAPVEGAVVRLSGAQNRKFITDANGVYRFENVETNEFYTVTPSRANHTFSPAARSFSQTGATTEAAFDSSVTTSAVVNPLDTPEYFVRQNYLDFLGREPDEAGFNFWSDQILSCGGDTGCVDRTRTNVSAAYFFSIEFQETGGLVDGLYRASYGVRPNFTEFKADAAAVAPALVVGRDGWKQSLENGKTAFVDAFVQRAAFRTAFDGMSNETYVDALIANTGVSFTSAERNALVSGLAGGMTRAAVLRAIVEDADVVAAKRNQAFVMMEYFGYLKREPDAAGYQFWLTKLNQFNGNFEQAEMVKAFIVSIEYRDRFPR